MEGRVALAYADRSAGARFFSRTSDLPTATRTLLLVIAENDSRSLRKVLDAGEVLLGEGAGLEALAPAVSAKLIEFAPGEVRFRHPLVRSAVHQAASAVMRHDAHAALARVIKDQSDRALWHRMASAIGPHEALASELDAAAARAQRRGALAMAILALEKAARLSGSALARSERAARGRARRRGRASRRPWSVCCARRTSMSRRLIYEHASPGFARSASL